MNRAKRARRLRQARKAGRSLRGEWAVDTAVPDTGKGHWALVDPRGRIARTGTVEVKRSPHRDSAHAEASAVLEALASMPQGATLLTDALAVAQALRSRNRRGEIDGRIGQIADRAEQRGVKIRWARRSNSLIAVAHRAGAAKARAQRRACEDAKTNQERDDEHGT